MTLQEFTARMTEAVSDLYGDKAEISVQKVTKDNGITLTGMMIRDKDTDRSSTVMPVVYLEPYFEKAGEGVPVHQLVRMLSETYEEAKQTGRRVDTSCFLSYAEAKDRLFCRLTGKEGNEERLSRMPHEDWQDLAVTYYVDVPFSMENSGMVQVTDSLLSHWDISEKTLRTDAWKNTKEQKPMFIQPLGNVLAGIAGTGDAMDYQSPLYLLSCPDTAYGAVCAAYPEMTDTAQAMLGRNFFMLPSSVHEFLLLPDDGSTKAADLENLVRMINSTEVDEKDVLSNKVYYCDVRTKEISLASDHERKMKEQRQEKAKEALPPVFAAPGL